MSLNDDTLGDDRLVGVTAIAKFRHEKERRTRHLIDKGVLPVGKEGNLVVASKRRLREQWEQITSGEDPAEPCREHKK
jgi:hypothetical protein